MSNYVVSHGARIYYQVIGHGKPLVLLHGNGENSRYFRHQVTYFRNQYQLILIDSRGHGRSTWSRHSLTMELLARDVTAVMDHLKIEKTAILGFSDGANIAFHVALYHPERVAALIAVSGNIFPKGMRKIYYYSLLLEHKILTKLSRYLPYLRHHQQLIQLMAEHPRLEFSQLHQISAQTLVMAGSRDMITTEHTRAIARAIPNASLVIVPGANHFGIYQQSDIYNQIIEKYLHNCR